MIITTDIKEVLEQGHFEGSYYYLPNIQLDRKLYLKCNDILNSIGLVWTKGKKAHIANEEVENLDEVLNEILETGEVETLKEYKKRYQFYPTPKEVAEYLIELAEIEEDDEVLEPSAGDGAIIKVIIEKYPARLFKLYANEINRERYLELLNILEKNVSHGDFLTFEPMKFDKIIMNPPFSSNQDVKHILKAYDLLNDGGRIVSVTSNMIQHKTTNLHKQLMDLSPEFIELPEGSFKESGTMVNTIIVVLNK